MYGQEIQQQVQAGAISPQLAQAIAQQNQLMARQGGYDQMRAGNTGAAGGLGVLALALGSFLDARNKKKIAQNDADIQTQIANYQAEQQRQIEEITRQKELKKLEREDQLRAEKRQWQLDDRNYMASQDLLKHQRGVDLYNSRLKEQREYENNLKLAELASKPKLDPIDEQRKLEGLPTRAKEAYDKEQAANKPQKLSGEIRNKLGLLQTAEENLDKYIEQAFDKGDYQEWGSKFGDTGTRLDAAVQNTLRAESGAVISPDEASQFKSTYSPSVFRSDETNMNRVQMFKDKIETQRAALMGQLDAIGRGELEDVIITDKPEKVVQNGKVKEKPLTKYDMNQTNSLIAHYKTRKK